jgi:16S rRNA (adenine1518-N6/adenine1519-N6)-dimethyltransferase
LETPRYPADEIMLHRVTTMAFGQRRKMLRSSLKGMRPDIEARLVEVGIDPTARAEEIGLDRFCALSLALKS